MDSQKLWIDSFSCSNGEYILVTVKSSIFKPRKSRFKINYKQNQPKIYKASDGNKHTTYQASGNFINTAWERIWKMNSRRIVLDDCRRYWRSYEREPHTIWNIPSIPGMLAVCIGRGFTIWHKIIKMKIYKHGYSKKEIALLALISFQTIICSAIIPSQSWQVQYHPLS